MYATLGLPVVPLEKLRNANFVFASPGLRRRSVNFMEFERPNLISSSNAGPATSAEATAVGSRRTTRLYGMPDRFAASKAVSM